MTAPFGTTSAVFPRGKHFALCQAVVPQRRANGDRYFRRRAGGRANIASETLSLPTDCTGSMAETNLTNLVQRTLQDNPHLTGRTLRFEAHEGRVVLRGEVASYYQKQIAQEAVRRLCGVAAIDNQLHVNWSPFDAK
jgi:hypothetical protein